MVKRDIEEREMDEGIYPARRSVIRFSKINLLIPM